MRPHVRAKVTANMNYHQGLASHYEGLLHKASEEERSDDPQAAKLAADHKHLADLHAEVAQQLRDVLGSYEAPAIVGATSPVMRDTNLGSKIVMREERARQAPKRRVN